MVKNRVQFVKELHTIGRFPFRLVYFYIYLYVHQICTLNMIFKANYLKNVFVVLKKKKQQQQPQIKFHLNEIITILS